MGARKPNQQMEMFMATAAPEAPEVTQAVDDSRDTNGKQAEDGRQVRKPRGRGIVYFGLREADEALRKIDASAKRMSRQGFAVALGHKKPENRFAQKVDALKTFTLLEEDADDVKLTSLATDMLYGGSEAARNQARAKAFLAYPDFQRTFIECPKNQDHGLSYIREFVTGKLGIINEADRFLRLFLESAHFAGLLDGEPDAKAERVRLRPSAVGDGKAQADGGRQGSPKKLEQPVSDDEAKAILEQHGLLEYADRIEVFRTAAGHVKTMTDGGKLTIEVLSPVRMVLQTDKMIEDLVRVLNALKDRGFQA